MIELDLVQGTPEWHAARAAHNCASEAPAMMGVGKYQTRTQLLHEKATGVKPEVDAGQQARFDRGHAAEAAAREILEARLGVELFPIVATDDDDYLLASVDGLTMDGETAFEHKLLNADVVQQIRLGELSPAYYWQLEQILLVTNAKRVIFVCSDGTEENFHTLEYKAVPGRAEELFEGWRLFDADLERYVPVAAEVKSVAATIEALPALTATVRGEVVDSNLAAYVEAARGFIDSINTNLVTDQDFADAGAAMNFCDASEKRLALVKEQALAQTESIDTLFRAVDEITERFRQKRLALDKLVKARKEARKLEIMAEGRQQLAEFRATFSARPCDAYLPELTADFALAVQRKSSFASMKDAVATAANTAKIAASKLANLIDANLLHLQTTASDRMALFPDLRSIVMKAAEDFQATVQARVLADDAAAKKRAEDLAEQERDRIRREEEAKARAATPAPAPAAAPAAVAPTPAPIAAPAARRVVPLRTGAAPKAASRPTDDALIGALALHYRVHESKVIEWLLEVDLHAASERLARDLA